MLLLFIFNLCNSIRTMINRKHIIKTIATFSLVLFFSTLCFAQNVTLYKNKPKQWITIVRNNYSIFLKPSDIKQTIALLPTARQAYFEKIAKLQQGSTINLDKTSDQELLMIFETDIVAYLLKNGKAYIENKEKTAISSLNIEKSPTQHMLDGSSKYFVIFSENNETVFVGSISSDLE